MIYYFLCLAMVSYSGLAASDDSSDHRAIYFDETAITKAMANAQPLIATKNYRILMAHHEGPGEAEIHSRDMDIIYCLEGEAEFVTGGKVIAEKVTAPNELRGTSIIGGKSRKIKKGDILVIPAGEPHWFKKVFSPFRYSVVKIPSS